MSGSVNAELNRLANGGAAYPTGMAWRGILSAANVWAGTTNLDLLGALNVKAGNTSPNLRDLNGVCNQLAGTVGLEAPAALKARAS